MRGKTWAALLFIPCLTALLGCPRRTDRPANLPPGPAGVADSLVFTTGLFEGCAPEGSGGDRVLNRLKNRDLPPPGYPLTPIGEILANHPVSAERAGVMDRSRWPDSALKEVASWENRGTSIEGYLVRVKQQQPEACNCKDTRSRDYHLWIVADPSDDRAHSVIAEVSPRLLPGHPNWRLRFLSRLATDKAKVRIGGWFMWDQEHPDQVGKSRGTQWEIHPIHRIEVWSGGRWRNLDG